MSLADLPDVLIAHLCSYLEYPDICNLMETSKKNYKAIKGYKKDKIKLKELSFDIFQRRTVMSATNTNADKYLLNNWNQMEENADKVKEVLDKVFQRLPVAGQCSSIDELDFGSVVFYNELFAVLMNTKTKIATLNITRVDDFTMEEKLQLCRKFSVVFDSTGGDAALLSDTFLTQILPSSTVRRWSGHLIGIDVPMPNIDLTLKALISDVERTEKNEYDVERTEKYI